jgi:hypothetical protein
LNVQTISSDNNKGATGIDNKMGRHYDEGIKKMLGCASISTAQAAENKVARYKCNHHSAA